MLGAIIGDIVGSTREWNNIKTEDFEWVPKGSRFTDDTLMTLAVAKWLMDDPLHDVDRLVDIMQEMGRDYPDAGYGGMFRKWLHSDDPRPYGSYGNGSAMRVSPVGLYAHSLDEALKLARLTALVSHDHPEGIKGAQAIAACVYLQRNEEHDAREKIKRYVEDTFGYNLDIKLEDIRDDYRFDSSCQGSVPIAIMAFLQRDNAVDALRLAISMGGDSDTIGCMTTAIASANPTRYNNLPDSLIERCRTLLSPKLLEISDRFEAFVGKQADKDWVRDRVRGSLIGGAIGDALGYPVEFMSRSAILVQFGDKGITRFELDDDGKAVVSDDTQMTLFTANGLLFGVTRFCTHGMLCGLKDFVAYAYQDWLQTQDGVDNYKDYHYCWIRDIEELNVRRAPGNTCLSALRSIKAKQEVDNDSMGCGGVMRVAPVGLMAAADELTMVKNYYGDDVQRRKWPMHEIVRLGGDCAEITHKHPLGYLPAAFQAGLVYRIVSSATPITFDVFTVFLNDLYAEIKLEYNKARERRKLEELWKLIGKAVALAADTLVPDEKAIRKLGEGWTGDEALAIAIYCTMRHLDSFTDALVAAVNHDGDSDSTGAVCGNLMGAIVGYENIPSYFIEHLEMKELILEFADDIVHGCTISEYHGPATEEEKNWETKYVYNKPYSK